MALSKEHKQRVIDAWLDSCNALIEADGDGYIVSPLGDEDIRLESWDELFETALYNNNESVKSLREQGESDRDIKRYGLILPELIARWTQEEQ